MKLAASTVEALIKKGVFVPANIRDRISELQAEGMRAGEKVDDDLRVALAGKYSCGKSSFIKSTLGPEWESLAPVKLERTTRCATYFRYGETLRITDKAGHVYSQEEYQEKVSTVATNADFLEFIIELPVESLKDLVVIDTPGFDPPEEDVGQGNKTDAEISHNAVEHADIVLFLMEMSDGTIQLDSLEYLQEIAKSGKTFYLILSKADLKKPASKRIEIVRSIREECKRNGLRPMGILPYCAKREKSLSPPRAPGCGEMAREPAYRSEWIGDLQANIAREQRSGCPRQPRGQRSGFPDKEPPILRSHAATGRRFDGEAYIEGRAGRRFQAGRQPINKTNWSVEAFIRNAGVPVAGQVLGLGDSASQWELSANPGCGAYRVVGLFDRYVA